MLHSNEFNSYIDYVCFQVSDSFLQWFAHKSAVWCHSQKYLCSVNHWCCCMSLEALSCKINKKWKIKKILVTFQQILTFLLFQCLTALELRFCLSWMLVLILSAVLIFSWLITHALFCCVSYNYKLLQYSKTAVRSCDFHFIKFHELD